MLPDHCPEHLREPLKACADGRVPPNIALMQLFIAAADEREAAAVLEELRSAIGQDPSDPAAERLRRMIALSRENPQAFGLVKAVLADVDHQGTGAEADDGVARWAGLFDRMARISPEGGVALYALGNPDLLNAATAEVVDRLRAWGLLGPDTVVIEIGCGIGRFVQALSPHSGHVTGIDISEEMIARAKERCAGLANVALAVSSGRDLAPFRSASANLVLAADVFPYLVQAGPHLVDRHLSEAARVLKPGGSLVVFNYSYRGDEAADRRDLSERAGRHGLQLQGGTPEPFAFWDAATFHLVRAAEPGRDVDIS